MKTITEAWGALKLANGTEIDLDGDQCTVFLPANNPKVYDTRDVAAAIATLNIPVVHIGEEEIGSDAHCVFVADGCEHIFDANENPIVMQTMLARLNAFLAQ